MIGGAPASALRPEDDCLVSSDKAFREISGIGAFAPSGIGLGAPRQPIQRVRADGDIRARGVRGSTTDVTDALGQHGRKPGAQPG